jgi:hypothetical protein
MNCKTPKCGDGYVDFNEECDYAAPGSSLATCRANCKNPWCGDGIVDRGEECDAGLEGNSDIEVGGCSTRCTNNDCGYAASANTGDLNRGMACSGCFYSYMGSSTRPPCYGPVHWMVAKQVQKISQSQIEEFQYVFGSGIKRSQTGNSCNLEDKYSDRQCMCMSTTGSVSTWSREACSPVPRKPALQTTFDILNSNSSDTAVLEKAIYSLADLLVREPIILPTYIGGSSNQAKTIACETEKFYWRAYTDLTEAVSILRNVGNFNAEIQPLALKKLIWIEHVLQFVQSTQVLTAVAPPAESLTNALALLVGSGAAAPFLPMGGDLDKETISSPVSDNAPVFVQNSVSGLQARLFRQAVPFNVDPELHRFSNIPDEVVWHIRFVQVQYLKQYGYRNNNGNVQFSLSEERVVLENNLLNLWSYTN